jgi:hypothetical protein
VKYFMGPLQIRCVTPPVQNSSHSSLPPLLETASFFDRAAGAGIDLALGIAPVPTLATGRSACWL